MTTIELDFTEQEYRKLQEVFATISMTVDDVTACLLKAVVNREEEILSRFQNGEPAVKILEEVSLDTLKGLFSGQSLQKSALEDEAVYYQMLKEQET